MHQDDIKECECRTLVRELNREGLADDEYARIAARDAATRAYGLDRYPAPHKGKGRTKAATAAQPGGAFLSPDGEPTCRV